MLEQGAVEDAAVADEVASCAGFLNHLVFVGTGLESDDLDGAVVLGVGAVDGEADLLAALLGDLLGEGEGGHRSVAVDV